MSLRSVVVEVVGPGEEPGHGVLHAVASDGRRILKDERCNLDQVKGRLVETDLPVVAARGRLCGHCFEEGRLPATRDNSGLVVEPEALP